MKRLVVCCDGTWQALKSPYPTNVVKIAQAVRSFSRDGQHQIVFYLEGLGTEGQTGKVLGGFLEMGIDKTIEDAYRFLCLNYVPGDEIYLFGFSRGAYTVRSLVGLIYCSGLLWRTNIRLAPQAYAFYRDHSVTPQHPEVAHFRRTHGSWRPCANHPARLLGYGWRSGGATANWRHEV